ncbi:hypothetical protein KDW80_04440 [Burkholderia vietnamiensis]|uniref:Uncharacterized protein n=1 Tax=Burkholderia vietnamiensis TaxID=60552 RepID=A0ABS1APM5_BURVI|nr:MULTISPECIES: hypothetical protein [Burkholderia]MBJ9686090.1 hypothetical protein [Burkholderia vietnamiensis]MBR8031617.1 hypothetical protein [Burkholderia vietnamiensis]MBR8147217.1 hypothetical protein [Burkholderia vietnamiensis]MBR8159710.1 hypothetical protein [Burkholderia vietnamiensis]MBR8201798.1 hypothetical protein [Burkholderia vietnamiensis]
MTAGAARRIGCVHRVPHVIDSDSNSRFDSASEVFRRKILRACASRFGNAFRLRSVTKNCPPRRIRITYIPFHFDAFVVGADQATKSNENEAESHRRAGGIQHLRLAMTEAAS